MSESADTQHLPLTEAPSHQEVGPFNDAGTQTWAPHPLGNPVVDRGQDGTQFATAAKKLASSVATEAGTGKGQEQAGGDTKSAAEEPPAE